MATIDQKFIERLDLFTESLGEIVVLLKEQSKKDNTDVVNQLLEKMDDGKMSVIVDELKAVSADVKEIKTDTNAIKRSIEDLKKEKEAGVFDRVSDPDNKKKIVDGIKVVALIAGGVLAMGMAFKLVGKVDPLSVMALSFGMVASAAAFAIISTTLKDKGVSPKDILITAAVLPIMAAGLFASSMILAGLYSLKSEQASSLIVISMAMGISLLFIGEAMSSIGDVLTREGAAKFLLLPLILPAISAGLMLSSYLLEKTVAIPPVKLLTIGAIAAASGLALFFIAKSISKIKLKKDDIAKFLLLPIILPALAGGIVLSAFIFQWSPTFTPQQAIGIVLAAGVVGLATLAMVPTVWLISKIKKKQALHAAVLTPLVAGAFVAAAFILQEGGDLIGGYDESRVPSYDYTLHLGLSMVVFGGAVFLLGKFLKPAQLIQGGIAVVGLSAIIMVSSLLIGMGEYDEYPDVDWVTGVGLSMLVFGGATVALGAIIMSGIGAVALVAGAVAVLGLAGVMVAVASIFDTINWNGMGHPTEEWAIGTGLSLIGFSAAMLLAAPAALVSSVFEFFGADPPLVSVAKNMVQVAEVLDGYNWKSAKHPTMKWAGGVGLALSLFALMDLVSAPSALVGSVFKFFGADPPIVQIAKNMNDVAKILADYNWDKAKHPTMEWSKGTGLALSLFALMDLASVPSSIIGGIFDFFGADPPLVHIAKIMIEVAEKLDEYSWGSLNYPTKEWAESVGMALSSFSSMPIASATSSIISGVFEFFGADPPLVDIAGTMIDVAKKLNEFKDWDTVSHPSKEWAEGVGNSLSAFSTSLVNLDEAGIKTSNFGYHSIKMIEGMGEIAEHIKGINWGDMPTLNTKWVDPVEKGLSKFIELIDKVDEASYGEDDRLQFFETVKLIPLVVNELNNTAKSKLDTKWINPLEKGISQFIELIDKVDDANYDEESRTKFLETVKLIPLVVNELNGAKTSRNLRDLSYALTDVSKALESINVKSLDKLSAFTDNMIVLSLVDEAKLEDFIDTIDGRKDELEDIVSIGRMSSDEESGYQAEIINRHIVVKEDDDKEEEKERFDKLMQRLDYITSLYEQMLSVKQIDNPDKITFGKWSESVNDNFV